jgi:transposase-like protein
LQIRRNAKAAKIFLIRLLKLNKDEPREIITDNFGSYNVAYSELIPNVNHNLRQYANNKAELSLQVTSARKRGI